MPVGDDGNSPITLKRRTIGHDKHFTGVIKIYYVLKLNIFTFLVQGRNEKIMQANTAQQCYRELNISSDKARQIVQTADRFILSDSLKLCIYPFDDDEPFVPFVPDPDDPRSFVYVPTISLEDDIDQEILDASMRIFETQYPTVTTQQMKQLLENLGTS